jgi:hypothetical protein
MKHIHLHPAPRPACLLAGLVAILVLAVSGCSGSSGTVNSHRTRTVPQAEAFAEQLLREAAAALTAKPTLEVYRPGSVNSACLDDNAPGGVIKGMVVVDRTYRLRGITKADNPAVGQEMLRYWKQKGYSITSSQGIGTSQPQIIVSVPPDGFSISLQSSAAGVLSIEAASPCLWPHGTPPSSS